MVGAEAGERVVLLPGTFSDRGAWLKLLGALTPRFRCLLFDPRGTGRTADPGVPFGPQDLVTDLLAVMDSAGWADAHLVGHSLGAGVALLLAAAAPGRVNSVVAISPAEHSDARLRAVFDHWEALARSNVSDDQLHLGLVLPAFGRAAFARLVPGVVRQLSARPMRRDSILRYVECNRRQDLRPVLGSVKARTLVIAGEEDALTGPAHALAVAAGIEGARCEILPGSGHTPQVEQAPHLARVLVRWLGGG
ncbi:MAG: alpha/beta hydrolase [Candidatus Dormibacteraeota bacterium]|nr:alpha/beta hydrolase [Candidatus Dormibacteraeota bacterium]